MDFLFHLSVLCREERAKNFIKKQDSVQNEDCKPGSYADNCTTSQSGRDLKPGRIRELTLPEKLESSICAWASSEDEDTSNEREKHSNINQKSILFPEKKSEFSKPTKILEKESKVPKQTQILKKKSEGPKQTQILEKKSDGLKTIQVSETKSEVPEQTPIVEKKCEASKITQGSEKKNEFKCVKCQYVGKSLSDYVTHAMSCTEVKLVGCPDCSERLRAEELDNHIKDIHLTPDIFKMLDNGSYHCIKCNKTSRHFSQFKVHLLTLKHKDLDRCSACGMIVPLKEVEKHQRDFHGKVGDMYVCKVCSSEFASKMTLDRHISAVHEEKKNFKCEECGISFSRGDNLSKHQLVHTEQRTSACCFCKLTFKTKTNLKEHIHNIHFKGRFQCHLCFRGFDDESRRDNHIRNHHEGAAWKCMVCGKSCGSYSKREIHIQSHLRPKKDKPVKKGKEVKSSLATTSQAVSDDEDLFIPFTKRESSLSKLSRNHNKSLAKGVRVRMDSSMLPKKVAGKQGSVSRKRKSDVPENSENVSPNVSKMKKPRNTSVASEMSTEEVDEKTENSTTLFITKESDLIETCNSSHQQSFHEGSSNVISCSNNSDESIRGKTSKTVAKSVKKRSRKDKSSVEFANEITVINDIEQCSEVMSAVIEGECQYIDAFSLQPSCTIPDKTFFVDVHSLNDVDSTIDSFSSLRPDTSVSESTLFIDVDNFPHYESIDIVELTGEVNPVEVRYLELGNGVGSFCSAEDVFAQHAQVETDSGLSVSMDDPPIKRAPAKKSSSKQRSRKSKKADKYPDCGKKVIVKNFSSNDDDFVLPVFELDEDVEENVVNEQLF